MNVPPFALGDRLVDLQRACVIHRDAEVALSPLEVALLSWLAARPGRLVPKDELLREVWGYRADVPTRAVDNTARRIRAKIEDDPGEPVHLLGRYGQGLRLEGMRAVAPVPSPTPIASPTAIRRDPLPLRGRDGDLARLTGLLDAHRLVTLVGPGGVGKTRLATTLAARRPSVVVELVAETDAEGAIRAVTAAVSPGAPPERLTDVLAARGPLLLVLDNLEQLPDAALAHLPTWLAAAPALTLLATSRRSLRLRDEVLLPLGPLPLPAPSDATSADPGCATPDNPAVGMFLDHSRRVSPDLPTDAATLAAIGALVRALDGLPLAIALVASRLRGLSAVALADRLTRGDTPGGDGRARFLLGVVGPIDDPSRHRSLAAAARWSWDLLAPHERSALAQLATFRAAFPIDAAEAVLDLGAAAPPALTTIAALADWSLLAVGPDGYSILAGLRDFAEEQREALAQTDRAVATAPVRHAAYFAGLGRRAAAERDVGRRRDLLAPAGADLLAAARHACAAGDPGIATDALVAARSLLGTRPRAPDFVALARDLLSAPRLADADAARVGHLLGGLLSAARQPEEAVATYAEAARRAAGDPVASARIGVAWGSLDLLHGRRDEARARLHTALASAEAGGGGAGDVQVRGEAHAALGRALLEAGELGEAERHIRAALACAVRSGDGALEAAARTNVANVLAMAGRLDVALDTLVEACATWASVGDRAGEADARANLAMYATQQGDLPLAEASFAAALGAYTALGDPLRRAELRANRADLYASVGRAALAREDREGALRLFRRLGVPRGEGYVLYGLGVGVLADGGDAGAAERLLRAGVDALREAGDRWLEGIARGALARAIARAARHGEAEAEARQAEALVRPLGESVELAGVLCDAALCARAAGDPPRAASLAEEAAAIARRVGARDAAPVWARIREATGAAQGPDQGEPKNT